MQSRKATRTYTADELRAMRKAGQDRSDHERVRNMSDAERNTVDQTEGAFDWTAAAPDMPSRKEQLTLRLDADVVEWFKAQGRGYQTRMNAVLRGYVKAIQKGIDR